MKMFTPLLCFVFIAFTGFGQPGTPDAAFGANGQSLYLTANYQNGELNDIALQGDGKIVATGQEYISSFVYNAVVARYKTNGTPDSSFGTNGFADASTNSRHSINVGMFIKVLQDGKILALLNSEDNNADPDIILLRFNSDGSRDDNFGVHGMVIHDIGIDYAYAMEIQSDGKIVFGGSINSISFVARCNVDGTPDTGFGKQGLVYGSEHTRSVITALGITSDQKILAAGSGYSYPSNTNQKTFIAKYTGAGKPDNSFGEHGMITAATDAFGESISDLLVLPGDDFLVAYFLFHNRRYYGVDAVVKYRSDGSSYASFGNNGKVLSPAPGSYLSCRTAEMALQQDGKIVLAGQFISNTATYAIAITRLLPNGDKDPAFGNGGSVLTHENYCKTNGMLLQNDGKIVVAGTIRERDNAKWKLALTRYLSGSNLVAATGSTNSLAVKKLTLFPNPAKDVLHITGLEAAGTLLSVVNEQGTVLRSVPVKASTHTLDISGLPKGGYYLRAEHSGESMAVRFVKE